MPVVTKEQWEKYVRDFDEDSTAINYGMKLPFAIEPIIEAYPLAEAFVRVSDKNLDDALDDALFYFMKIGYAYKPVSEEYSKEFNRRHCESIGRTEEDDAKIMGGLPR